ncbi:MAG: hypothetical protein LBH06_02075 [Rikenellaceae bacterium]|jgi:hypothetical protein|nr:hypothetical protein [Rikenellaceae bacterium]
MNYFSYKLDHDYGLAPNPFHGYCTVAVCKSQIRNNRNLSVGDWIIGTGSKALSKINPIGDLNHLIYAMQVNEKITFDEYWRDERFQSKKPVINGSLVQMYGDNIYHIDPVSKKWIQEDSAHSANNNVNKDHLEQDTGGEYVLISQNFYYFGDKAPLIPGDYREVCCNSRDYQYRNTLVKIAEEFIRWLENNYEVGIHGDPINWTKHLNQ